VKSQLGALGTSATKWLNLPACGDYEDGEFGGMMLGRGNRSTRRKPAQDLSTNLTCPGRRGGKPVTNLLSCDTALTYYLRMKVKDCVIEVVTVVYFGVKCSVIRTLTKVEYFVILHFLFYCKHCFFHPVCIPAISKYQKTYQRSKVSHLPAHLCFDRVRETEQESRGTYVFRKDH
jgi:hypothetical protein